MFKGEIIIANGDNLAVTNHCIFLIEQKLSDDRKSMSRFCRIEAQRLFNYDGEIKEGDRVDGVIRLQVGENEDLKYFSGIMVSLNMGLAKIQIDGELQDENVEQFLKHIERYEFSR